jgi:hypothetical protein
LRLTAGKNSLNWLVLGQIQGEIAAYVNMNEVLRPACAANSKNLA